MRPTRPAAAHVAAALVAIAAAVGCQAPPATPTPPPAETGDQTISLCPPSGSPLEQGVTDSAIGVLESRLAYLGVTGATITAGTCIDITLADSEDPAIAAALGSGHVSLVAVAPERLGEVVVGGAPAPDSMMLAADRDIVGAGTETGASGQAGLALQFAPTVAQAIRAWTSANVGGSMALVVDGVVVAVPSVAEPIQGDRMTIAFAEPSVVPLQAIEAMLASGPLPEEWAQPQVPQG